MMVTLMYNVSLYDYQHKYYIGLRNRLQFVSFVVSIIVYIVVFTWS